MWKFYEVAYCLTKFNGISRYESGRRWFARNEFATEPLLGGVVSVILIVIGKREGEAEGRSLTG